VTAIDVARRRHVYEHKGESRRWNNGGLGRRPYARTHFHDERRQFVARLSDWIHCSACREWLRVGGMMLVGRLVVAVSRTLMMGRKVSCEGIAAARAAERAADLARYGSAEDTDRERERQEASRHLKSSISNQPQKDTGFL
jgi:hypothetical protein